MPLVILESADGGGKTTLAGKLLKGTGHPTLLIKRSGSPGSIETLAFQAKWIADQSKSGLNIIADRHPVISEAIYAPTVRGVPCEWNLKDAAEAMRGRDLLLVYCRTGLEQQYQDSHKEAQMEGVHDKFWSLFQEYDRWMDYLEQQGIPMYRYDYRDDPDAVIAIERVKEFWEKPR